MAGDGAMIWLASHRRRHSAFGPLIDRVTSLIRVPAAAENRRHGDSAATETDREEASCTGPEPRLSARQDQRRIADRPLAYQGARSGNSRLPGAMPAAPRPTSNERRKAPTRG